ncbi:MAG: (2Fe-2S)-binding protein [Arcobacteraceae bacterium]
MADFQYSYIVCTCKHVTLGEIICSIKDNDAKTIEDVGNITDAGTACGCCRSSNDDYGEPKMSLYLDQILNKFAS